MKEWTDIFPAIMIPLNRDYSINELELRKYIEWLLTFKEIKGVVVNGHTGEISGLTPEERKHVTKIVVDQVKGRALVISGVCAEGSFEAIRHARDAEEVGADGILLMPIHTWLRFGMKKQTVINYFTDVASAVKISVVVHLYPATTKAFYPVELLLELAKIPNVVAIKVGTRDMALYERDIRILRKNAPHLSLLTCQDEFLFTSMIPGVDGALVGFAACVPELITQLWSAVKQGDLAKARQINDRIWPLSEAIYGVGQPSAEAHARMKYLMYLRGIFSTPVMRPPIPPLEEPEKKAVEEALKASGLGKVLMEDHKFATVTH